ncbi:MAG: glucose-6-phosphate isomerase, partial [Candidatus Marinimicrobia bacterium]|nr:glucose-6-phosphate isomerase [Candidatus Neomarinimicrobiota bacterium]
MSLHYDDKHIRKDMTDEVQKKMQLEAEKALDMLLDGSGEGSEFTGWLDLANEKSENLKDLMDTAKEIKESGDILICIGIGGSYLGAKAVISALYPDNDKIRFAGHHLSPLELSRLVKELENKDFYINVISKSGTTTEPGVVFRILKNLAETKYGTDASKRIVATTDAARGALKTLADAKGYRTFVIPDDVGGRFSVLTPVGLLPILAAGANLDKILKGAADSLQINSAKNDDNIALRYAVNRQYLYRNGKAVEILADFEPQLHTIAEWWKQLYGESEGKNKQGIFPAAVDFTTDLHSMGQWIQDGVRNIFETFLIINNYAQDLAVPSDKDNLDKLN